MRIKKLLCIGLAAGLLLLSAGCGALQKSARPITVALPDDIVSLDAANTKDLLSETVIRCIYSTLFSFDEQMNPVPSLAESYNRDSELEWTFKLHKNVRFHDGTPLTAEDVKFSIERAQTAKQFDHLLLLIEQVEVIDPATVKMTTALPYSDMPILLARVSSSVMSKKALENPDYSFEKPVGSGPFQVNARTPGKQIELERFDQYFLAPAKSQLLTFVVQPSEQTRTANLLNKQFDIVFRISSYDCDFLKLNEEVKVYEHPSTKMELLIINPRHKPLDDIRVRRALVHAINRQNLIDNVLDGYGVPLNSMLPSNIMGAIETPAFAYDPALSKQLLAEAGYADGFDLPVLTFDAVRKKQMEYIKLDLAQVGIRLNYEFLELKDYLAEIEADRHQVSIMSWTSNPDPDSTLSQLYSKNGNPTINHSHYSDPVVEQLLIDAKGEQSQQNREQMYRDINRIVSETYLVLPLYQPDLLAASSRNIEGVRMHAQCIFGFESIYRAEA